MPKPPGPGFLNPAALLAVLLVVLGAGPLLGCGGSITSAGGDDPMSAGMLAPSGPGGSGPGSPPAPPGTQAPGAAPPGSAPPSPSAAGIGSSPLRRLTHAEYDNTVADLLGGGARLAATLFPGENAVRGYVNQAELQIPSALQVERWAEAAGQLAADAVLPARRAALVSCVPAGAADAACTGKFVQAFTLRAFRRPIPQAEIDALVKLGLARATADGDFWQGVRIVVEVALQSPWFLYRIEFGSRSTERPGLIQLDDYAVATRLAYLLTGSMPDPTLLDLAAKDLLATPAQLEVQARRLVATPKAPGAASGFFGQWLGHQGVAGASKDVKAFPLWKATLASAMAAETARLMDHIVWEQNGDFFRFLNADFSYVNAQLGAVYGIAATGSALGRVALPAGRRGVLGHGSFLAARAKPQASSPTLRGLFVRERLLCEEIPPPPPGVDFSGADPAPDRPLTGRERSAAHTQGACAEQCHKLMDPIGFGLEKFDAIGAFRETEAGKPIDDSGVIEFGARPALAFRGLPELADLLYRSPEVKSCTKTQFARWWLGREVEPAEHRTLDDLAGRFAAAGHSYQALLVAAGAGDAMRFAAP